MRVSMAGVLVWIACSGVAQAQSAAPSPSRGYVEVVAQSALGNVTSQSFGGEFGVTIVPNIQVFVEAGMVHNIATADISASAQQIAGALSQVQTNVGYTVKQPVTFGVAGLRYLIPVTGGMQPYVMAGIGLAKVSQNAAFTVGGTDVTGSLSQPQYGSITLGSDLTGSFTKPMFTLGGGVALSVWQQVVVDLQYRYGRILAEDGGINVSRAGIGLGVRF
jgi:opacity protein-like surface antigen